MATVAVAEKQTLPAPRSPPSLVLPAGDPNLIRRYEDYEDMPPTWGPPPSYTAVASASTPHSRRSSISSVSSSSSLTPEELPPDNEILDSALEFTHHTPPPAYTLPRLEKRVAVPQVNAGAGIPFARAYSDVLAAHGVSQEEFLQFIDNFNVVSTESPPLQVLDLAGGIIGFV